MNGPLTEDGCDTASDSGLDSLASKASACSTTQSSTNHKRDSDNDYHRQEQSKSIENTPSASDFAQTRSPPPVIEADQLCIPLTTDQSPENAKAPSTRQSPFERDFASRDTATTFFTSHRKTPVLEAAKASKGDVESNTGSQSCNTKSKSEVATVETSSNQVSLINDLLPSNDVVDALIHKEATRVQGIEKTTDAAPDVANEVQNTRVSSVEALEQDSTDDQASLKTSQGGAAVHRSQSMPYIPPLGKPESPQTSWGWELRRELDMPHSTDIKFDCSAPHPLLSTDFAKKHPESVTEIVRSEEYLSTPYQKEHLIELHHVEIEDILGDITEQLEDASPIGSPPLDYAELSLLSAMLETPTDVHGSLVETQKVTSSPGRHQEQHSPPVSNEHRCIQDIVPIPADDLVSSQVQYGSTAENEPRSKGLEEQQAPLSPSPEVCSESGTKSGSLRYATSEPTETSESDLGGHLSTISDDPDAAIDDKIDLQLAEFQASLNRELSGFRADFVKQLHSMLVESTERWNSARNSIAAKIIARPSINAALELLESSIKEEIHNKHAEVLKRSNTNNAESLNRIDQAVKSLKRQLRQVSETLPNTIIQHIDQRWEELMKTEQLPEPIVKDEIEELNQKEVQPEVPIAEKEVDEPRASIQTLSSTIEQMKTLMITTTNNISEKLDTSKDITTTEQSRNIATVGAMQRQIIANLQDVLVQSTLQNQAINCLASQTGPLANMIRGISNDTTFIDAKLAKNAAVLTEVTQQAERLEKTAVLFDRMVSDAGLTRRFDDGKTVNKLLETVNKVTATTMGMTEMKEQVGALQDRMTAIQEQMGQVLGLLKTRKVTESPTASAASTTTTVTLEDTKSQSHSNFTDRRISESGYVSATESNTSEALNNQTEPPTIGTDTRFIFEHQKHPDMNLDFRAHFTISDLSSVSNLISKGRKIWTEKLAERGLFRGRIELLSIRLPATIGRDRQLVDNDEAYGAWYKAATTGDHISEGQPILDIEFLICEGEIDIRDEQDEPRSKKRKQEEMRKNSDSNLEFSLRVWNAALPKKYIRRNRGLMLLVA